MIQDVAASGSLEDLHVQYYVEEKGDEVLEYIILRPMNSNGEVIEHIGHQSPILHSQGTILEVNRATSGAVG